MTQVKRGWSGTFDHEINRNPRSMMIRNSGYDLPSFFQALPHEVLIDILYHISRIDLIQVSSTCSQLRFVLNPYMFALVKCPWDKLIDLENCPLPRCTQNLIESLRISTSDSKNEWTYPFHELFNYSVSHNFTNLHSLELQSSGSTSFFKYCKNAPGLKRLKINTTKDGSLFSLDHVKPFPNLESLEVSNFHIDEFEEQYDICPNLKTLRLTNCTWDYPFDIENFGRDKIVNLSLQYSNSFIISERFRIFLNKPGFTKLESLELTNNERNLKLTISLEIMKLIKAIPTLRILKLKGNIYNETLNNFTKPDLQNCMNYLALDNVKVFYSSFFTED